VSFDVGQRVRISGRSHSGHHRTPDYVKGKTGTVVVRHGAFTDPETRAYGADGLPKQHLYLVALEGESSDRIYVDVYEHWLEADA
jgi:Nitrile hydratase beta subunit, C-terminal